MISQHFIFFPICDIIKKYCSKIVFFKKISIEKYFVCFYVVLLFRQSAARIAIGGKMAFDGITLACLVGELNEKLTASRIDKISQPEKDEIVLSFRADKNNYRLLISANASLPRMYLIEDTKKENPLKAPAFLMLLRKHLLGGRIIKFEQDGFDRTVDIHISTFDELQERKTKRLTIEIMSRHSNIILVDDDTNKIIDAIKKVPLSVSSYREVLPGDEYKRPPAQNKLSPVSDISLQDFMEKVFTKTPIQKSLYTAFSGVSPLIAKEICHRSDVLFDQIANEISPINTKSIYDNFIYIMSKVRKGEYEPCIVYDADGSTVDFSCVYLSMYEGLDIKSEQSMSCVCEKFYNHRDIKERLKQKSHDMRRVLSNKISLLVNKIDKQTVEMNETLKKDEYKKDADLLTAYIYMIQKGMSEIEVDDFYSEPVQKVKIKLDENISPSQNIQRLYKRYNKLKVREVELSAQIANSGKLLHYLRNIELSLENADTMEQYSEIVDEMAREGIIKRNRQSKGRKQVKDEFNPMRFISSDGYNIYVGKSNKQNDILTMRFANDEDMWLHTKNIAGSHAIIRAKNAQISDNAVRQAAMIAAYYSKAKESENVPVDYTLRKNVKKPNGAKDGMVIYETNSTIYVTPDEEKVKQLKLE